MFESKEQVVYRQARDVICRIALRATAGIEQAQGIGIVEQDSVSGRYDLGSYALDLGLSGLGRLDPVRLAGPILENLCEEIHETVALAVWGNHGATIVRIKIGRAHV